MNRRSFLAGLGALVGGIAVEQAIPLNRVWSFPTNIVIRGTGILTPDVITRESLAILARMVKAAPPGTIVNLLPDELRQIGVDFLIKPDDLRLPLPEFSVRYLQPTMLALASKMGGDAVVSIRLPLPKGIDRGAVAQNAGLHLRTIQAYDAYSEFPTERMRIETCYKTAS